MGRRRFYSTKRRGKPGAVPGTLLSPRSSEKPRIDLFAYGTKEAIELKSATLEQLCEARKKHDVLWVNVIGFGDVGQIEKIGSEFGLHRLALEDVVSVHQRPKAEEFQEHIFVVMWMIHSTGEFKAGQMSMFLGKGYLLTFQEQSSDCLDSVREQIRSGTGHIRQSDADYLCYAVIDSVIDGYFPALEQLGETLEQLEDRVVAHPERDQVRLLHEVKGDLLQMRRVIWPCREMINTLIRNENILFSSRTMPYLRDCYDHTIQLMDIVETYREIASGLVDVYISSVSAKLNEIMKVLTIIATIFMPLGFIASLYGMNFDRTSSPWNMPELGWYLGYPFALLIMAVSIIGLLWFFWRKGWIGDRNGTID